MAYNGPGGYGDPHAPVYHSRTPYHRHRISDLTQHPYDDDPHRRGNDEDEVGRSLLHSNPTGANPDPFDSNNNPSGYGHLGYGQPEQRPQSTYSLTETYATDSTPTRYPGEANAGSDVYSATGYNDPAAGFGAPARAPSPYDRSETSSTADWRARQQPGGMAGGGLKRGMTRKVKLVQGSVLSADYPVPSAIQNAIQAKYRNVGIRLMRLRCSADTLRTSRAAARSSPTCDVCCVFCATKKHC